MSYRDLSHSEARRRRHRRAEKEGGKSLGMLLGILFLPLYPFIAIAKLTKGGKRKKRRHRR